MEKWLIFIRILMGFLVCGLIVYELLPTTVQPIQGELSCPPGHKCESYPLALSLSQVNESTGVLAQIVVGTRICRVSTKSTSDMRKAVYLYGQTLSKRGEIFLRANIPDTAFRFTNRQSHQYLNIPPPPAPATL